MDSLNGKKSYRVYPGGRTELVSRVPTGTKVLQDAEVAADLLSQGEMVYVDRDSWEEQWISLATKQS
jgi:hypothetical protein